MLICIILKGILSNNFRLGWKVKGEVLPQELSYLLLSSVASYSNQAFLWSGTSWSGCTSPSSSMNKQFNTHSFHASVKKKMHDAHLSVAYLQDLC